MSASKALTLAMICALALGCGGSTGPRGCDVCTTSAIVYGTVRSAADEPVPAVRVSVDMRRPTCGDASFGSVGGAATTDDAGHYRLVARSLLSPTAVCLIVNAEPPAAAPVVAASDTGYVVRLQPDYPPGQAMDSVQVDLVLPAAGT